MDEKLCHALHLDSAAGWLSLVNFYSHLNLPLMNAQTIWKVNCGQSCNDYFKPHDSLNMLPHGQSASSSADHKQKRKYVRKLPKGIGMKYVGSTIYHLPPCRLCRHCGATLLAFESNKLCCSDGEVSLVPVLMPEIIRDLFTRNDAYGDHFRQFSRVYNNFFAFSSLGGGIESSTRDGVHTLHVQGQLYHFLPNLVATNSNPNYLQMYFYDGALELDSRMKGFGTLNPEVVKMLMLLTASNPYARFFRSSSTFQKPEDFAIKLKTNPVLDQRVYNAPTTEEVAVIFVDDISASTIHSPDITVHAHGNQCHRVLHFYGCYDPLQYPLLFCAGESGWHQGILRSDVRRTQNQADISFPISTSFIQAASDLIALEDSVSRKRPRKEDKTVSCREYYSFRFQIRPYMSIVNTRRIFLQYSTDMYIKIENTRLDFIKNNQNALRSELYQGVVDSVNDGVRSASDIGRRVVLPASFIGGPRDMKRRYLNAMSLVQRFGKPDLFITMTCNPAWSEIEELLNPGETSQDRPDIIARVFRAKIVHLKELVIKQKIFGEVFAHVDVIEFQKRGLPHLHMLVILAPNDKIRTSDCYENYVSAELPSTEYPVLHSRVVQHMMHGPCGKMNPKCPCMKNKGAKQKCRFDYPKDFAEFSTCAPDSYPIYRRRNNGDTVRVRGKNLDNRWVIPHNPFLLVEFDCHINVEICSTVKAVKYIYKYIYKGHDRICFDIERNHGNIINEPDAFQSARWVSPPEAAYRIFRFDLYDMQPSVFPLQVHLPQQHNVTLHRGTNLQDLVNDPSMQTTMLTAYFEENKNAHRKGDYLYMEYPEHYVWHNQTKKWFPRKQRGSIGRMIFVSPAEGERYYLRLLLCHERSATSFDHLMTVDGLQVSTFKEACEKHGYIDHDDYADACMEEAVQVQMPIALRRLFSTLLVFGDTVNPLTLWNKYQDHLSEDFTRLNPKNMAKVASLTFREVEKHLESMGKKMQDYNISDPNSNMDNNIRATRDIVDALNAPIPSIFLNASAELNLMQRRAYDSIMDAVLQNKGGAFFVDGPGGTGKTFLYCALYTELRTLGKIVLPTATSGLAASNIPSGRTAHSRFKIPIDTEGSLGCNVPKQSSLAALLCKTSLIIWDEASMAKKEDIEALDLLLRDVCNTDTTFGGKVVVFGGDFRQVLPVLPHKSQNEAVKASLVTSYLWPLMQKYHLTENIRAREDPGFSEFLLKLGNGEFQSEERSLISLPSDMINCLDIKTTYADQLISAIFSEMKSRDIDPHIFSGRAILTPTNECVDDINEQLIACFHGDSVTYTGIDTLIDDNHNLCTSEFLNTLCPPGMSPYQLILKKECPVILLRNLDPSHGLCNGTRLICKEFLKHIIVCEIASGYHKGERVFLPRIYLRPPLSMKYPFAFQRKQFPIKLCFAMTINKAQGQTLQKVCVFLQRPCFSHGQLYVALSRARNRCDLTVFSGSALDSSSDNNDVMNVVSFSILNRSSIT